MFEETNIKIYRCVKGDIDRREAKVNINFLTSTNLIMGSSNTNYVVITFLCQGLVTINKKGQVTPILIKFFSMFNDRRTVTLPHTHAM